ncbi:Conserved hypothetical protein [Candidatus Phytoplasma australiense]|uniref:Sequence-variable mosaic (SVM) signal sequence domain-containing protein n=2 Tax=Phytoplasma australiense TaxID=59748 RepID=B1V8X8_PHYAS|nr:SVM family protein [Candidatus Phytoplasma australiense]AGL89963.1 hypothetical protein SLY_0037 [Strawberry lethal yellows phytoplasma (CPA) str. NZSb11]CAM11365.1 Conserved hypothetical protein [Candidatus Phytoplasma australiense]
MFKLQNQLKIISICLLAFLGMLLINNNQVMAMNNGHSNGHDINNGQQNQRNLEIQAGILLELNNQQARIGEQIINASRNNASEETINNLVRRSIQLSQQISNQQIIVHNAMPRQGNNQNNPNPPNNNRRR